MHLSTFELLSKLFNEIKFSKDGLPGPSFLPVGHTVIKFWHTNSTRSLSWRPAGGRSAPTHRPPPKESIQFDTGRGSPAFYRSIRGGLSRPAVGTTSLLSGASQPVSFWPTSCETAASQRLLAGGNEMASDPKHHTRNLVIRHGSGATCHVRSVSLLRPGFQLPVEEGVNVLGRRRRGDDTVAFAGNNFQMRLHPGLL